MYDLVIRDAMLLDGQGSPPKRGGVAGSSEERRCVRGPARGHEQQRPDRSFKPGEGLDISDYVLAGGGFPITVKGAGVIGVIRVHDDIARRSAARPGAAAACERPPSP